MNRLRLGGQSLIEYVVILAIVAIISIIFALNDNIPDLFTGYVEDAREAMKPPIVIVDGQVVEQ